MGRLAFPRHCHKITASITHIINFDEFYAVRLQARTLTKKGERAEVPFALAMYFIKMVNDNLFLKHIQLDAKEYF